MSSGRRTSRRAAVALTLGLAVPVAAQTPAADEAKAARVVADQKLADEVTRTIAEAQKLAVVSKPQALDKLNAALVALDVNGAVGADARRDLTAKLNAAIKELDGRQAARPAIDPNGAKIKAAERAVQLQVADEWNTISTALSEIRKLKDARRDAEAAAKVALLQARFPNNPVVQGLGKQTLTADLVKQNEADAKAFQLAWTANQRDIDNSAVPTPGDIQFPNKAKWIELTKLRREADRIKLTPKEEQILKSLDNTIAAVFDNRPFEEALQELSNLMGQEIHVDKASLTDAGLDLSRRVNIKGRVTARTALRAMLQSMGLTFVVKDEMIQVMSLDRAERELTTRSYYLGDVLQGGPFGNEVRWGPALSYQQTVENANTIVKLIHDSIDPQCWKDQGGRCTISFHLPTMSIVVRASTEVHAMLGGTVSGKR